MKVFVAGMWHLGTVTAACCAAAGHQVIAFDDDPDLVSGLNAGKLPVAEPGLPELVRAGLQNGSLRFSSNRQDVAGCEVVWICYDTPVNENDEADTGLVISKIRQLLDFAPQTAIIFVSSQMPVGSIARLEREMPGYDFAYSPENLRLGKAIDIFTNPDRVVISARTQAVRDRLTLLFQPVTSRLLWMSIESAEMTKHAINAFLATSVTFINEVGSLCEKAGADAQEVERGLKTDVRIGEKAYLHAGAAFAGGTLARDVSFLLAIGRSNQVPVRLLQGVLESNRQHNLWIQRNLTDRLTDVSKKTIGILGLTYKPGTDTLRRSSSIETCRWLADRGADVTAFDPAVSSLPDDLKEKITLKRSAEDVFDRIDAIVIGTMWPEFRNIDFAPLASRMKRKLVLDPSRFVEDRVRDHAEVEYLAIGVNS